MTLLPCKWKSHDGCGKISWPEFRASSFLLHTVQWTNISPACTPVPSRVHFLLAKGWSNFHQFPFPAVESAVHLFHAASESPPVPQEKHFWEISELQGCVCVQECSVPLAEVPCMNGKFSLVPTHVTLFRLLILVLQQHVMGLGIACNYPQMQRFYTKT